jgi:hypothetical protein
MFEVAIILIALGVAFVKSKYPLGAAGATDIVIIEGEFFKRSKANGFCLIRGKSYGLRSGCFSYKVGCTLEEMGLLDWGLFDGDHLIWTYGPNRVRGVLGIRGEVSEGLAVVEPRLSSLGGRVRVVGDNVFISLVEKSIALFS